jgi:hypothetical protein
MRKPRLDMRRNGSMAGAAKRKQDDCKVHTSTFLRHSVTSHGVTVSSHPHWRGAAGELSIESKTSTADWVHTVHDADPGIGHEDLRRASHSVPQQRPLGTGLHLGLSIVRRAVELLGRNMFDHEGARARTVWEFLVRLALHSYVRFSWILEYILK